MIRFSWMASGFAVLAISQAWGAQGGYILRTVDGLSQIEIRGQAGVRQGLPGETLVAGDQVTIPEHMVISVQTPDGGVLAVGQRSQIRILGETDLADGAISLLKGALHGVFAGKKAGGKPYRFILQTAFAVMAIRGTDFVVMLNEPGDEEGTSEFFLNSGNVEIAKTTENLTTGSFIKLMGGQALQATPQKFGNPVFFKTPVLVEQLKKSYPGLAVVLVDEPPPSAVPQAEVPHEVEVPWTRAWPWDTAPQENAPNDSWRDYEFNLNYVFTKGVQFDLGGGLAYTPQLFGILPYGIFEPRLDLQITKTVNGNQLGIFGLGMEALNFLTESVYMAPGLGLGVAVSVKESITYGFPYFAGELGYRCTHDSAGKKRILERVFLRYRYLSMKESAHEVSFGMGIDLL